MNTKDELAGRVALVTGAGSGIGRASALTLARAGARVGLVGRTAEELAEVRERITSFGGTAYVLEADVADEAGLKAAIDALVTAEGRLDIVFANAGVNGVWAPIDELATDEWRRTLDINLTGTFLTIKFCVPHLRVRGGSVVVCSSVNGTRMFSNTGATAYVCSKAAQAALTKVLAVELGRQKIRVNVVCPGAIDTPISENTERRHLETIQQPVDYAEGSIPLTGRAPGAPEDIAEAVLYLASDRSKHVNGTELWIDGGQSLVQG
jgi:NAD(P)-dependent dehydrogenase (short-subunit alcohol dehydrogenase family)